MPSLFCGCGRLLLSYDGIIAHMTKTEHCNFWGSLSDKQNLRCMQCDEELDSLKKAISHNEEGGPIEHIILTDEEPPALKCSTPGSKQHRPSEDGSPLSGWGAPFKTKSDRIPKDSTTSIPYLNDSDDEEDVNIPWDDLKCESGSDSEPDNSASSEEDQSHLISRGKRLFQRRNLKNLGFDAVQRKELRSQYVIAEAMGEKKVVKGVNASMDKYVKQECFRLYSKGTHGKIAENGQEIDVYEYNESLQQIVLKAVRTYKTKPAKGERMNGVAKVAKICLEGENKSGLRENSLHYMYPEIFNEPTLREDQIRRRISKAVCDFSQSLKIPRECLKIKPAAAGLIRGDVKLYVNKTLLVDCKFGGESGTLIPSESVLVNGIEIPESVKNVLIIEKETIFSHLAAKNFDETDKTVLVTGLGHADVATRILLRKMKDAHPTLEFYALVDCNPSGAQIYLTYNIGSEERAYDLCLNVSEIRLLGMYLGDISESNCLPLTERDEKLLANLRAKETYTCYATSYFDMRQNLIEMGLLKRKADLDMLLKENRLVEYVREKLHRAKLKDEGK